MSPAVRRTVSINPVAGTFNRNQVLLFVHTYAQASITKVGLYPRAAIAGKPDGSPDCAAGAPNYLASRIQREQRHIDRRAVSH